MRESLEQLIDNIENARYYDGHEDLETYWHTIRKTDEPLKNLIKGFINGVTAFELVRRGKIDSGRRVWKAHVKWRGRLMVEDIPHYALFVKADAMLEKLHEEQLVSHFLKETDIIDYANKEIQALAKDLASDCQTDVEIAKNCFTYVRDNINHSGDDKDDITTCKASDVLRYKTGWCYAKSHLLASLLRANNIPAGFCYQRLSCSEYKKDIYCLHGLNAIYLKKYGWYKVDVRGNKEGVDAQFTPPVEKLAFALAEDEFDFPKIYEEPLEIVVQALEKYKTYAEMIDNFPDIQESKLSQ